VSLPTVIVVRDGQEVGKFIASIYLEVKRWPNFCRDSAKISQVRSLRCVNYNQSFTFHNYNPLVSLPTVIVVTDGQEVGKFIASIYLEVKRLPNFCRGSAKISQVRSLRCVNYNQSFTFHNYNPLMSFPTVIVVTDGQEVGKFIGSI
jgi:thioredoxin-like negative regulator of GroEL